MEKITGKIRQIFEVESFNGFSKRKFWLEEVSDKYPEFWQLELWKSDCSMIDSYEIDDYVTCFIDIKGKYWERDGKSGVMNTLKCWNIEKEGKLFKSL